MGGVGDKTGLPHGFMQLKLNVVEQWLAVNIVLIWYWAFMNFMRFVLV